MLHTWGIDIVKFHFLTVEHLTVVPYNKTSCNMGMCNDMHDKEMIFQIKLISDAK
jgi:hypothetical protein